MINMSGTGLLVRHPALEEVMRRRAPGLWAQLPHVPNAVLMEAAHDWLQVVGARHFAN